MQLAASVLAAGLDIQKSRHHVNTVNTYLEIKHIFGLSGKKLNKKINDHQFIETTNIMTIQDPKVKINSFNLAVTQTLI